MFILTLALASLSVALPFGFSRDWIDENRTQSRDRLSTLLLVTVGLTLYLLLIGTFAVATANNALGY